MSARVAAHVHSTWSYDGGCSLSEVATLFRRCRYDGVLMTEHSRTFDAARWDEYRSACERASRGIQLVPGIEYEDASNTVHVLVWGVRPFLGSTPETTALLRAVEAEGGLAVLAHPNRRGAAAALSAEATALLGGVELWNRRYDGWAPPRPSVGRRLRPDAVATVGLDFHRRLDFFPLALALDMREPVTEAAVVAALREGRYVATALGVRASRFGGGLPRALVLALDALRRTAARAAGI
jgi:predicted metal-dependent phosphoesterase TrpH